MRRTACLLAVISVLSGCSETPHNAVVTATAAPQATTPPSMNLSTKVGLILNRRTNVVLYVGDTDDEVARIYKPPTNAIEFRELPPGFSPPYRADGFQSDVGSLGILYYNSRVAQAMFREDNITFDDVNSTVQAYSDFFGKPTKEIPGVKAHYWFWEDVSHSQRLMICGTQKQPSKYELTQAVGDDIVMSALRMSPAAAREDLGTVEATANVGHPG